MMNIDDNLPQLVEEDDELTFTAIERALLSVWDDRSRAALPGNLAEELAPLRVARARCRAASRRHGGGAAGEPARRVACRRGLSEGIKDL